MIVADAKSDLHRGPSLPMRLRSRLWQHLTAQIALFHIHTRTLTHSLLHAHSLTHSLTCFAYLVVAKTAASIPFLMTSPPAMPHASCTGAEPGARHGLNLCACACVRVLWFAGASMLELQFLQISTLALFIYIIKYLIHRHAHSLITLIHGSFR